LSNGRQLPTVSRRVLITLFRILQSRRVDFGVLDPEGGDTTLFEPWRILITRHDVTFENFDIFEIVHIKDVLNIEMSILTQE